MSWTIDVATLHLALIAYDVTHDRDRARLADWLEARMTRVQDSLFEGWMTRSEAEATALRAAALVEPDDSVRLYLVPRGAVADCRAWGFPPAPCPDGALIV